MRHSDGMCRFDVRERIVILYMSLCPYKQPSRVDITYSEPDIENLRISHERVDYWSICRCSTNSEGLKLTSFSLKIANSGNL